VPPLRECKRETVIFCRYAILVLIFLLTEFTTQKGQAQIQAPFNTQYSLSDLGQVAGVPFPYGAMTFSDPNTLLLVGCDEDYCGATVPSEAAYLMSVTRDTSGHIVGFNGTASVLASSLDHVEAGMAFGPGGVLFYNDLVGYMGEIKPGSTTTDKLVPLDSSVGFCGWNSGMQFAPNGQLKVLSYGYPSNCSSLLYTVTLSPDGNGTYDATSATQNGTTTDIYNENFTYVPNGSPVFSGPSLVDTNWSQGVLNVYAIDTNYNPVGSPQVFAHISGAFGSVIDPVTNDLLVSTWEYGSGGHIYRISGFAPQGAAALGRYLYR
jgi:hypothetical protein